MQKTQMLYLLTTARQAKKNSQNCTLLVVHFV